MGNNSFCVDTCQCIARLVVHAGGSLNAGGRSLVCIAGRSGNTDTQTCVLGLLDHDIADVQHNMDSAPCHPLKRSDMVALMGIQESRQDRAHSRWRNVMIPTAGQFRNSKRLRELCNTMWCGGASWSLTPYGQ